MGALSPRATRSAAGGLHSIASASEPGEPIPRWLPSAPPGNLPTSQSSGRVIRVEFEDDELTGVLDHVIQHSPSGLLPWPGRGCVLARPIRAWDDECETIYGTSAGLGMLSVFRSRRSPCGIPKAFPGRVLEEPRA